MTFWQEIITLTRPIGRGVWNFPHKFHLYIIKTKLFKIWIGKSVKFLKFFMYSKCSYVSKSKLNSLNRVEKFEKITYAIWRKEIFGMASMPFLCNGTLLFQCNLPRVLPVTIFKFASCLIPYIVLFLYMSPNSPYENASKEKNHDHKITF